MKAVSVIVFLMVSSVQLSLANYTDVDARIYGGRAARLGQFPWQVYLEMSTSAGTFVCGGSLISDQWVLTAAHCTQGARSITARMGVIDKQATTGQTMVSSNHIEHPRYDSQQIVNDIALVKLPNKVKLNQNVNIIKLPRRSQAPVGTFEGRSATISGWGRTSNAQSRSVRYLQSANVKVMSHRSCERFYSMYTVGNGEICTNNAQSRSGTCQGDSGGPLSIQNVIIGLTSWGVAQCQSSAPSVYTNVAAYLGFINAKTGIPIQ